MIKKCIATFGVVVGFLVMLGFFGNLDSQQSQITNKQILTATSSKIELANYFKEGYKTKAAIGSLFTYIDVDDNINDKKINTFCEDVLLDPNDIDACLLTISLYNSSNLNTDLSYTPLDVSSLNLNGEYSKVGWEETSVWLEEIITSLKNLNSLVIKNYKGNEIFSLNNELLNLEIYNNNKKMSPAFFSSLPKSLNSLVYKNSKLDSLEEVYLKRLINLNNLDLSNNNITQLHYKDDSFAIGNMTSLETINLACNKLIDISGLFRTNTSLNNLLEINLSNNQIKENDNYGNESLFLKNSMVNINLSNNNIVDANKIFENIEFNNELSNDFKLLGKVDLSNNDIVSFPSAVAEITHTLILNGNDLKSFSIIAQDAKLDTIILEKKDLNNSLWKEEIYVNGRVATIKQEYIKWFLAKGESENNPLSLSVLQNAYIDEVLVPVTINLYMVNVLAENPNAIIAKYDDLVDQNLGDEVLDIQSVKDSLSSPTNFSDFNIMVTLATNGINKEVIQSYTSFVNYKNILQNKKKNTNSFLPNNIVITIIVLSILGIILAATLIGIYFFKKDKSIKKGDF